MLYRKAVFSEIQVIYDVLKEAYYQGHILPVRGSQIQEYLKHFWIAFDEDKNQLAGVFWLYAFSESLVELKSLVVQEQYRGQGIGTQLCLVGIKECSSLGYKRLFVLTRQVGLFNKLGFRIVEKAIFPEKIWKDCQLCPKKDHCDETAMIFEYGKDKLKEQYL